MEKGSVTPSTLVWPFTTIGAARAATLAALISPSVLSAAARIAGNAAPLKPLIFKVGTVMLPDPLS